MQPPTNKTSFNTMEVRKWHEPQHSNSKDLTETIHSTAPPMGLNWLDVAYTGDLRIKAHIDNVATDSRAKVKGTVHLDSSGNTVLYSAGCTWLDVCQHDRDFQFGTFTTGELSESGPKKEEVITFKRPFFSTAKVIVWIQDLDIPNCDTCRIKTYHTDLTPKGFKLTVETWEKSKVNNAKVSWIAYPDSRSNIESGKFHIKYDPENQMHSVIQKAKFNKNFQGKPDVYVGFSVIDIGSEKNQKNLRLKTFAKNVTAGGMDLHISAWNDTAHHQSAASWLAIQSC